MAKSGLRTRTPSSKRETSKASSSSRKSSRRPTPKASCSQARLLTGSLCAWWERRKRRKPQPRRKRITTSQTYRSEQRRGPRDRGPLPTYKEYTAVIKETTGVNTPIIEDILAPLAERPQWVNWRLEPRDDKPTKVPYTPGTNRRASS